VLQLGVVGKGQTHKGHSGHQGSDEDERRTPAAGRAAPVGYGAEQGQHKQRQHIVQRHDKAGPGLGHAEFVRKNQGDGVVIRLPERAYEKKGEAHAYGALVVQFHLHASV